ncbi:MAG: endonuclease/exonuclease/phosphatase family protein, partial [Armatimonadetes bacterium]|nr:endonuclease/exonuclease/phosphatase family protein [Armatimonadota bacterium]
MWISLTLCFMLLAAMPTASGRPASPDRDELKIISFNIRFANPKDEGNLWEDRREMMFGLLREQKPDVIGLQEALRSQIDDLRKALPRYEEFGVGRADGKSEGEHSTILYDGRRFRREDGGTFWLSDTPEVVASKSWGNRVVRICTWARLKDRRTGRAFYVYNTHLDHESQPSRERSAQLLLERIRGRKHSDPVILMGDFNAGEGNAAVRTITASEHHPVLRDTFR